MEEHMATETTIDVRDMAPRERHPRIFSTFDSIAAGDAILLINDHDPKPLFYQFQAERTGQVAWTPQEQGPERWVIRIEKVADTPDAPSPGTRAEDVIPLSEAAPSEPLEGDVVVVDVRDDIRLGREPFARIMGAVTSLRDGQELRLINVFEPVPLYEAMSQRGFAHETARLEDGDWQVRFFRQ
jgi:uncharacterized protein (DUF2249 family)